MRLVPNGPRPKTTDIGWEALDPLMAAINREADHRDQSAGTARLK